MNLFRFFFLKFVLCYVSWRFKNATNTSRVFVILDLGTPSLGHKPIRCPVYHTAWFHISRAPGMSVGHTGDSRVASIMKKEEKKLSINKNNKFFTIFVKFAVLT